MSIGNTRGIANTPQHAMLRRDGLSSSGTDTSRSDDRKRLSKPRCFPVDTLGNGKEATAPLPKYDYIPVYTVGNGEEAKESWSKYDFFPKLYQNKEKYQLTVYLERIDGKVMVSWIERSSLPARPNGFPSCSNSSIKTLLPQSEQTLSTDILEGVSGMNVLGPFFKDEGVSGMNVLGATKPPQPKQTLSADIL